MWPRPRASFVLLTGALALGGCAAIHRPPTTVAELKAARSAWATTEERTVDTLVDGLLRRATRPGAATVDLLFLSGGGQNGAYGAGFLQGWQSRPDASFPTFDLVSGVSAGAIEAPFAFLGNRTALDAGATLFHDAARNYAPTFDWLFWLFRTGGVTNVKRFRAIVNKVISPDLRTELDPGFADGRHLIMSTTDFDLGVGHVWDLGHELDGPDGVDRARDILLGSTALPSIFPPVVIDGHVHADGGVMSNLCVPLVFEDYRRLSDALGAVGVTSPVTVRLWVVMNVFGSPLVQVTDPSSRSGMYSRATTLVFSGEENALLGQLTDLAQAVDGLANLRMELRVTAIPGRMADDPGAQKFFDEKWMQALERFGYDRARGPAPWDAVVLAGTRPN